MQHSSFSLRIVLPGFFLLVLLTALLGQLATPGPERGAAPATILDLPGSGTDETKIDYAALPEVKGTHAVVNAADATWKFQLHNYLVHHGGRYWCTWSQGPPVEDEPTQHVRY